MKMAFKPTNESELKEKQLHDLKDTLYTKYIINITDEKQMILKSYF